MDFPVSRGIPRTGLNETFQSSERRKSNLLIEARLLRDEDQDDAAALRFAEAAAIEEQLRDVSAQRGLIEKSWVHRFSAASCWAAAGNFYDALEHCQALCQPGLPERLRLTVSQYSQTIRERRAEWYTGLERESGDAEVG